jgi:multidrug efflux pump subunit AcrB
MTAGVEDAIRQLEPGLPGITFDTKVFQQANFVKLAISNLTQALVIGFILVVVILALFLFEWRMALISLLTIPLSLVATLLVLYWLGATINTMTLAGLVIALGAVVDDAIIDVENHPQTAGGSPTGRRRRSTRGDPERPPRGPQPDRSRHAHHRRGVGARLPAGRADRGVLPAARLSYTLAIAA